MRVTHLRVLNYRSIENSGWLELGPITLLEGKNNSGKSSLLRALYALQTGNSSTTTDVRYGADEAVIQYMLTDIEPGRHWRNTSSTGSATLTRQIPINGSQMAMTFERSDGMSLGVQPIPDRHPANAVFPFFSTRKAMGYAETINKVSTELIEPSLRGLVARMDPLVSVNHPRHQMFMELLDGVLNLPLTTVPSDNGKRIGVYISDYDVIYLEDMGEGVAQLLGFIVNLCVAKGQIFLIEELENDIHPEALKLLLRAIESDQERNQFVLSTHNNIVLRNLGALSSTKIYELTPTSHGYDRLSLPTTRIKSVGNSTQERTILLSHLGYELSDMDLWDGWLLLEESSAERIIRSFLIPWFAPRLANVRTMATNGTGEVDRSFSALHKLVLFTHLEERYRGKVLVILDGDASGRDAIEKLRRKFRENWSEDSFDTFSEESFEHYYPSRFRDQTAAAFQTTDRDERREAKRQLLLDVVKWIEEDELAARNAFELSAAEVISRLQKLETRIGSPTETT